MAQDVDYTGFMTLDEFTRDYLARHEYSSDTHLFGLALGHAIRGLREISYEAMAMIRGEVFDVGENKRIRFSDISVDDVYFVGVISHGRKVAMLEDNTLPMTTEGVINFDIQRQTGFRYILPMFNQYGELLGGEFGMEPTQNAVGFYRKDIVDNSIIIASDATKVYLEFRSPVLTKTGTNYVPEIVSEALSCWIDYQRAKIRKDVSLSEKMMLKKEYTNAKKLLIARESFKSIESLMKSFNRRNKQTAKH